MAYLEYEAVCGHPDFGKRSVLNKEVLTDKEDRIYEDGGVGGAKKKHIVT